MFEDWYIYLNGFKRKRMQKPALRNVSIIPIHPSIFWLSFIIAYQGEGRGSRTASWPDQTSRSPATDILYRNIMFPTYYGIKCLFVFYEGMFKKIKNWKTMKCFKWSSRDTRMWCSSLDRNEQGQWMRNSVKNVTMNLFWYQWTKRNSAREWKQGTNWMQNFSEFFLKIYVNR